MAASFGSKTSVEGVSVIFGNEVHVRGAGIAEVNGIYTKKGENNGVGMYKREAPWAGNNREFSVYRYRHVGGGGGGFTWYISILGDLINDDFDFYFARAPEDNPNYPPVSGWETIGQGL